MAQTTRSTRKPERTPAQRRNHQKPHELRGYRAQSQNKRARSTNQRGNPPAAVASAPLKAPAWLTLAHHLQNGLALRDLPVQLRTKPVQAPEEDLSIYASLFEEGEFQLPSPGEGESRLTYCQRTLKAFFEPLSDALSFQIRYGAAINHQGYCSYTNEPDNELEPDSLNLEVTGFTSDTISAHALMNDPALPEQVGTSLLTHLSRACQHTLPVIFIKEALELAEMEYWMGDVDLFRDEYRYYAAEHLDLEPEEVTDEQLDAYLREEGIITPEALNERIGLKHLQTFEQPLSLDALNTAAGKVKNPAKRGAVQELLSLIQQLHTLNERFKPLIQQDSGRIEYLAYAQHPHYSFVLDVTPWEAMERDYGTFQEIINDHEEHRMQATLPEAPSFAMQLKVGEGRRLRIAAEQLSEVAGLLDRAVDLIRDWEMG